ncbi:MAG: DUF2177 family protein [Vannielia sp.]|uniref:DUF2177 family protein n=1 Tax=Rhodobacterales TaxID=204455 RepID=UPI002095FB3A|nr:DUF2177 family protein [Oceanicola sp. 502str15]MCO6384115.1 DUF2177 family protein [Oceanicola sp. 502str15]
MKILALYAITATVFLAGDALGLKFLIKPVFDRHVGHLLASPLRLGPAAAFYLAYVAGVLWFVSLPAMRTGDPMAALINGALIGLLAYGTYEFTNYATLRDWSVQQVVADTLWGGFLTGVSAWAGVALVGLIWRT